MDSSPVSEPAPPWPMWKRVGFRALLIYFVLYIFPFPLGYVPGVEALWQRILASVASWVYYDLLGRAAYLSTRPTGSGDMTYVYLLLAVIAVLTLATTAVWSFVDRKPRSYAQAARWLEVGCRVYLGSTMITYGLQKLIPLQMPAPTLDQLVMPVGELSPMRLVWVFMGTSPIYESLSGLAETLGGLLLFWRRTRLLGATIVAIVMTNVVMLNFFYDIPVKLMSSHLLAMAIALTMLDGRRLLALFVLNQPAPPADLQPISTQRRINVVGELVKLAYLLVFVAIQLRGVIPYNRYFGSGREHHELWGIHDVETFVSDGVERPPLLTDETRWRALIIDRALPIRIEGIERPGYVVVQSMDGELTTYHVEFDDATSRMRLSEDPNFDELLGDFVYARPEPERLVLTGTWAGAPAKIELRTRDLEEMLLISRGFHWINEYPH